MIKTTIIKVKSIEKEEIIMATAMKGICRSESHVLFKCKNHVM